MKKFILFAAASLLLAPQLSFGAMEHKHDMKHMDEHMGSAGKNSAPEKTEAATGKEIVREAEEASVKVRAVYRNPGEAKPQFEVVLDTHSVDLDELRLEDIVVLRDSNGSLYKPAILSARGSGHHREALVEFSEVQADAGVLDLIVKDVASVKERVFRFE